MLSSSLLIKPKFFNTFLRIEYCHLDLFIFCVLLVKARLSFSSHVWVWHLFVRSGGLVTSEVGGGKRNNPKQALMHQPAQQLTGFWGPMPNVHIQMCGDWEASRARAWLAQQKGMGEVLCVKTSSYRPQSSGVMREFCINSETGGSCWLLGRDKKGDGWIQAHQLLGLWEYHGVGAFGSCLWAHEQGDLKRPTWIYQTTNCVWPTWLPSVMRFWMRGFQCTLTQSGEEKA